MFWHSPSALRGPRLDQEEAAMALTEAIMPLMQPPLFAASGRRVRFRRGHSSVILSWLGLPDGRPPPAVAV